MFQCESLRRGLIGDDIQVMLQVSTWLLIYLLS